MTSPKTKAVDLAATHLSEPITGFRAWSVSLPLRRALQHATAEVSALTAVVVELELAGAAWGRAEIRSNGGYATGEDEADIASALRATPVSGRTVGELRDALAGRSRLACMAVDTAAWDAFARRAGMPLYRAWNPAAADVDSVRTHAPIGFGDIDTAVALATSFVAAGFHRLKIRVGGSDLGADIARVRAIRTVVGPEVEFVLDANGGWSYDTAAAGIEAFADMGVVWLEQPVTADADLARLRKQSAIPIYADESARDAESVEALAADDAVDGVHLKLEKCATAERLFQAVAAAQTSGLKVALGQMDQGQLGCAVTTHFAVALGLDHAELWGWGAVARDVTDTLVIRDGRVVVPAGAGNGVDSIDTSFAREIM